MTDYAHVFEMLDSNNKGYISYDDFVNKINIHLSDSSTNHEDESKLNYFIRSLKPDENGRIYLNDFLSAVNSASDTGVNELTTSKSLVTTPDLVMLNEQCLFINDGDNYSTEDSGFDRESRYQDRETGKRNKRLIKCLRNMEGDNLRKKNQQLDEDCLEDGISGMKFCHKGSYPELPQEKISPRCHSGRRQRSTTAASDFVTCSSNRLSEKHTNRHDNDAVSCGGCSPCGGSAANLYYIDSMTDVRQQLERLEKSFENLTHHSSQSKLDRKNKTDYNEQLQSQIRSLEDRLKEQRYQFNKDINMERENSRKNLLKLDQTKSEEVSLYADKLRRKELELESLHKELTAQMTECERIKYDKLRTDDKLGDLQLQLNHVTGEMKRLKEYHKRELDLVARERVNNKTEDNSTNLAQTTTNSEQTALEETVSTLRQENHRLRLRLEESEAQLLTVTLQQGREILSSLPETDSNWMSELDNYSKQEVVDLLIKEKDGNFRLREYINGILTRIIEKDPTLLEI